jgi:hypothetical protein
MALTANDILTRARARYNADDDGFFSDTMLLNAIYDAESILAREGYVIEKTYTTPAVAGTRTYTLPATTLGIKEVKYDYKILEKDTLDRDPKVNEDDLNGTPLKYAQWQSAIILYPAPALSGSVNGDGDLIDYIDIRVYKYPDDVTSISSTLDIPEEYKDCIIHYLLMQMAFKDQNIPIYNISKELWDTAVISVKKQRAKSLRTDKNARVKDTYFGSDTPVASSGVYF